MIAVSCPVCGLRFNVPDSAAGGVSVCPQCHETVRAPGDPLEGVSVPSTWRRSESVRRTTAPGPVSRPAPAPVVVQVQQTSSTAGVASVCFGLLSCLIALSGLGTCGLGFYAAIPFAMTGTIIGIFAKAGLRTFGIILNVGAMLPAIITTLLLGDALGRLGSLGSRTQEALQATAEPALLTVGGLAEKQSILRLHATRVVGRFGIDPSTGDGLRDQIVEVTGWAKLLWDHQDKHPLVYEETGMVYFISYDVPIVFCSIPKQKLGHFQRLFGRDRKLEITIRGRCRGAGSEGVVYFDRTELIAPLPAR